MEVFEFGMRVCATTISTGEAKKDVRPVVVCLILGPVIVTVIQIEILLIVS